MTSSGALPAAVPSNRVATVRSLKRSHAAVQRGSCRLSQRVVETHRWLAQHVDPVLGDCVTFLLVNQPSDAAAAMREYLQLLREGANPCASLPQATARKVNRDDRRYMTKTLSPMLEALMNKVLAARPSDVLAFMIQTLGDAEVMSIKEQGRSKTQQSTEKTQQQYQSQQQHQQQSQHQQVVKETQPNSRPNTAQSVSRSKLEDAKQLASKIAAALPRKVQLLLVGPSGSGKTSFLNALQGKKGVPRPTMGFKPVRMSLADQFHITFYDLGGGKKIRDIWSNYFHDVHGVLYFVDSSEGLEQEWPDHVQLFQSTVNHQYLQRKPLAVVCSNQAAASARQASNITSDLGVQASDHIRVFSCPPFHTASMNHLNEVVQWMMQQVDDNYKLLADRVKHDSWHKEQENLRKERERERRLFKEKLASIFVHSSKDDCFEAGEGIEFLASEVGSTVADLPPEAYSAAEAVGYHKLLLQMVGAMRVPISTRRQAVDWLGILDLLDDVRREVGLEPCQRIQSSLPPPLSKTTAKATEAQT